ncbi:MAG: cholesterol desaturase daf-36 [Bacteroidota bacterium]|nr:cholesterol desaturase daf-36 [Bacteroidota bacterium]
MLIKISILLGIFIFSAIAFLYVMIFVKTKKRKKPIFDPEYEKLRSVNYPPAFPNGWFSIGPSSELKTGQVKEIDAFGQKLAVFRGEDGHVGVVDVYCPHLNANLAYGTVKGNHLVCPFHGWEFKRNGKCANIPYCDEVPENAATRAWIVKENWGLILVWYHSKHELPTWDTAGYIEEIKEYKYHGKTSEILRIHLQDFAENGADYAHFSHVHQLLTIPLANRVIDVKHTVSIRFGEGSEKHMAFFSDKADLVWKSSQKEIPHAGGNALVTYYGPGFLVFQFVTEIGNLLLLKTFTPLGVLKVKMEDHIYAPRGTSKLAIKYLLAEASAQFIDDINIWERKNFAAHPLLVKGDGPIMKMRSWYKQFYTEQHFKNALNGSVVSKLSSDLPINIQ